MHADDAIVDQRAHWHVLEAVRERLPQADVVPALALVVEPVDLVDVVCFVVSAEQEKLLRVLHLVREEETDALDALLPSIHIVPR